MALKILHSSLNNLLRVYLVMKIELKKAEEETIFVVVFQQCLTIELHVHSKAIEYNLLLLWHMSIQMYSLFNMISTANWLIYQEYVYS